MSNALNLFYKMCSCYGILNARVVGHSQVQPLTPVFISLSICHVYSDTNVASCTSYCDI